VFVGQLMKEIKYQPTRNQCGKPECSCPEKCLW